jgi:hypothetical protein
VLHYFRFRRRFPYAATEAGAFNSDVLVFNGTYAIEIEVKTSLSDLKNEWYKPKHRFYFYPETRLHREYTPNKFYIAVPKELVKAAIVFTSKLPYGVIEVDDRPLSNRRKECFCKITKKASPIHLQNPSKIKHSILLRMGSELIQARLKNDPDKIQRILLKVKTLKKRLSK